MCNRQIDLTFLVRENKIITLILHFIDCVLTGCYDLCVKNKSLLLTRKEEYSMKGTKLFKNARLKGQKELVSILVEDGIIKKISADIPYEKSTVCEEVDLNGQLVIPPYVDPHLQVLRQHLK